MDTRPTRPGCITHLAINDQKHKSLAKIFFCLIDFTLYIKRLLKRNLLAENPVVY